MRRVFFFVLLALLGWSASGQEEPAPEALSDPVAALNEGNRLFRNGQLERAVEVYRQGWEPENPHPTLVYNLGTALHHLGHLPEAVLWYRRAADSNDPWLEENLWLARRSLGSQALPPGGVAGTLAGHGALLRWSAVALAWIGLLAFLAWREMPKWLLLTAFLATAVLYGTAWGLEKWGPEPAVLLVDCASPAGELPAGSEAWVKHQGDGAFRVVGTEATCPPEAVGLVRP